MLCGLLLWTTLGLTCSGCGLPRKKVSYNPDIRKYTLDYPIRRAANDTDQARRQRIIRSLGPGEGYVHVVFAPGVNAERNVTHDTLFGALLQAKKEYADKGLEAEQIFIAPKGLYINHVAQLMLSIPPLSFCRAEESFRDLYGFAMEFTIRSRDSWEEMHHEWSTYEPAVVGVGSAVMASTLKTLVPFGAVFFLSKSIVREFERQKWLQAAREGRAPMPAKTGIEVEWDRSIHSLQQCWTMVTAGQGRNEYGHNLPAIYVIDDLRIWPYRRIQSQSN